MCQCGAYSSLMDNWAVETLLPLAGWNQVLYVIACVYPTCRLHSNVYILQYVHPRTPCQLTTDCQDCSKVCTLSCLRGSFRWLTHYSLAILKPKHMHTFWNTFDEYVWYNFCWPADWLHCSVDSFTGLNYWIHAKKLIWYEWYCFKCFIPNALWFTCEVVLHVWQVKCTVYYRGVNCAVSFTESLNV